MLHSLEKRDTEVGVGATVIVQRTQGDLRCWPEDVGLKLPTFL